LLSQRRFRPRQRKWSRSSEWMAGGRTLASDTESGHKFENQDSPPLRSLLIERNALFITASGRTSVSAEQTLVPRTCEAGESLSHHFHSWYVHRFENN
ncbi:unnamed protein product, partial [Nesidiocoris tenuis]